MGKINFANIQSALGKAKEAAAPLQNKGHTENVPVDFIVLADRNIYNESDNDESIKELADNIEACGLLHPITVNKIGAENFRSFPENAASELSRSTFTGSPFRVWCLKDFQQKPHSSSSVWQTLLCVSTQQVRSISFILRSRHCLKR